MAQALTIFFEAVGMRLVYDGLSAGALAKRIGKNKKDITNGCLFYE